MTARLDQLIQDLTAGAAPPLAPLLRHWIGDSRAFLTFAEQHASKIRKKARLATHPDDLNDLLAELAVAALLLRDRRFAVQYEALRAGGGRSPDFQVRFRTQHPFNLEATRLRLPDGVPDAAPRLARTLQDKIHQFPSSGMNVLAVVVPDLAGQEALVPRALHLLDAQAHAPTDALRAYLRGRHRLSAVALCAFGPDWRSPALRLWPLPTARHPLSPELTRALTGTPPAGQTSR